MSNPSSPPPVAPGPADPYTLSNLMPQPGQPTAGPPPGYPAPPVSQQRKPHWFRDAGSGGQAVIVIAAVLVPLVVIALVATWLTGGSSASSDDLKVSPPSCNMQDTALGAVATVSFTVTNNGNKPARNVRVGIEYRDSGGARVDTDTARISDIPAGDTVRVEESTNLDAGASGGSCELVGISAD